MKTVLGSVERSNQMLLRKAGNRTNKTWPTDKNRFIVARQVSRDEFPLSQKGEGASKYKALSPPRSAAHLIQ
jgi:hypothetical protein